MMHQVDQPTLDGDQNIKNTFIERPSSTSGIEIDECENSEDLKTPLLTQENEPTIYFQRWVMLGIYSYTTMNNAILFMGLSAITNIAAGYYNVKPITIEWSSNLFIVIFAVLALPGATLINVVGLRGILIGIAALQTVCSAFHLAGFEPYNFYLIIVGQIFGAVAFGFLLQVPSKLSFQWFPEYERAKATSIGVFMNIFGVAIGFVQPTNIVEESTISDEIADGMKLLFAIQLAMNLLLLLISVVFFRERPPTPPSVLTKEKDEINRNVKLIECFKLLITDKYFVIVGQSFGIYFGLICCIAITASALITSKFTHGYASRIGWMGFGYNINGIIGCFLAGVWLDRSKKYQLGAIVFTIGSAVTWLAFILVLFYGNSFTWTFILFTICGFLGIPYFAAGVEQVAEMTYPVPEEISSGFILMFGTVYGSIFIAGLGGLAEENYNQVVGYTVTGLYILAFLLACVGKTELKRDNAESRLSGTICEEQ